MRKLIKSVIIGICYFLCIMAFTNLFSDLSIKESLANEDFNIPIYIIDKDNLTEIKVDTSYTDNYSVEKITLKNLSTDSNVKISPINNRFFIYSTMNRGDEYSLSLSLRNGDTKEIIDKVVRFNYIDSKFSFKNITQNSFDASFRYTRKNMIFIDSVEIYGKDTQNSSDKADFHLENTINDISIFKKSISFNNIGIKPSTTYNLDCIVNMKNNVHLVTRKTIKSKDFKVTDLKCDIIGENLIELKWDTSDDVRFLDSDSIKVFVKTKNDVNYSDVPNIKILDDNIKKSFVNLDKLSSEYDIKLAYDLGGKEVSSIVKQINTFYDLNTDLDVVNIKDLLLKYSFKNNMAFNMDGKLDIYLLNESLGEEPILISSKDLNTDVNTVEYSGLKSNSSYKVLYKIFYSDESSIIIKEESFSTPEFSIKDVLVTQGNGNYDGSISWSLDIPEFRFSEGDSLKVYIKNKEDASYSDEPIFYRDMDLNNVNSFDITIPENMREGYPHYDVKLVYNVDGIDYIAYDDFVFKGDRSVYEVKDEDQSEDGETSGEESPENDYQHIVDEIFYVNVKDQKVNEVIFNIHFPKSFEFTEGDNVKIFRKLKNEQKNKDELKPDYEFIHSPEGEKPLDLSTLTEMKADYLQPNKEYEFDIIVSTKNYLPNGEGVPLPIFPHLEPEKKLSREPESEGVSEEESQEPSQPQGTTFNKFTKKLNGTTASFTISSFSTSTIGPNSAVFNWQLSQTDMTFNEKDMAEIYIKRKIVGGYPPKSSFKKVGEEIKGLYSGLATVTNMNMDYTAKLVYTISGAKFEKTLDFRTISAKPFCLIQDITEHSAKLHMVHPEGYIFVDGDAIEIYAKEASETAYPKFPLARIENIEGTQSLNDLTTFNITSLKPDVVHEVLVKYLNRANDIPDAKVQFKTKPLILNNCRIDSMSGKNLRIKTDMENNPEILDYVQLYVDVFYKPTNKDNYYKKALITTWGTDALDFQVEIPDVYTDYDLLVSYSPHGYFNEKYFIDFELPYRCIQGSIERGEREEEGVKYRTYNAIWNYGDVTDFKVNDKLSVYLKEIPNVGEGNENPTRTRNTKSSDYVKIHTFESNIRENTFFNLDSFLKENTNYEVLLSVDSERYLIGPTKIDLKVDILRENQSSEEDIFETPVDIQDFVGEGDYITFSLPYMGDISLDSSMPIECDIENVTAQLNDDGSINVNGLVPGKEYPKIEVTIYVEESKSITVNLENIRLDAVDPVQTFLYNVYQRAFLRDPDEGGYHYWINELKNHKIGARDFLLNLLFAEKEFSELEYSTDKFIEILYSIVVDRDPDEEGLTFWINFYNNEILVNAGGDAFVAKRYIVDRMINEPEFKNMMEGMGLKY